jgi:5'-nucleotidase/UDP-sugar diphosphatase
MDTLPSEITVDINTTAAPEVKLTYGGFPCLMTLLNDMEEISTANAILKVHAGDVFTGTLFYTLFGGYADTKLMTPMCFDVMTLGNHDFDDGNEKLETFLTNLTEAMTDNCGKATQVVSANVIPPADTKLVSLLLPYVIKEYDGQVVAIIGLTTKDTKDLSSPDKGTKFLDELTTLNATVAELEEMGINKIIAMTHVGHRVDMETISSVKGVDVIIGARSHTLLNKNLTLDYPGFDGKLPVDGPYPTMSNDVCIVTAWCFAHVSTRE